MTIILIDGDTSTLTISWPPVETISQEAKSTLYELQYKRAALSDDVDDDSYVTLSNKLTSTQAKKKNLNYDDGPFFFRVRPVGVEGEEGGDSKKWTTHPEPFQLVHPSQVRYQLKDEPDVVAEGDRSVLVKWKPYKDCDDSNSKCNVAGYELQMRPSSSSSSGFPWKTIAPCLKNTEVRKRNLEKGELYQFRVRPVFQDECDGEEKSMPPSDGGRIMSPFSPPSKAVSVLQISQGMERLFHGIPSNQLLVSNNGRITSVSLEAALANKVVLLYASAHWCPPCRKFTPQLANFYASNKNDVEIIFLSCDHDENGFASYFATMPWKAIPFESDVRERLLSWINVSGIPRLVVLNKDGGILEDNAVGKPLDVMRWKN